MKVAGLESLFRQNQSPSNATKNPAASWKHLDTVRVSCIWNIDIIKTLSQYFDRWRSRVLICTGSQSNPAWEIWEMCKKDRCTKNNRIVLIRFTGIELGALKWAKRLTQSAVRVFTPHQDLSEHHTLLRVFFQHDRYHSTRYFSFCSTHCSLPVAVSLHPLLFHPHPQSGRCAALGSPG